MGENVSQLNTQQSRYGILRVNVCSNYASRMFKEFSDVFKTARVDNYNYYYDDDMVIMYIHNL